MKNKNDSDGKQKLGRCVIIFLVIFFILETATIRDINHRASQQREATKIFYD